METKWIQYFCYMREKANYDCRIIFLGLPRTVFLCALSLGIVFSMRNADILFYNKYDNAVYDL